MTDEDVQVMNKINGSEVQDHSVMLVIGLIVAVMAFLVILRIMFPPPSEYKYKDD